MPLAFVALRAESVLTKRAKVQIQVCAENQALTINALTCWLQLGFFCPDPFAIGMVLLFVKIFRQTDMKMKFDFFSKSSEENYAGAAKAPNQV